MAPSATLKVAGVSLGFQPYSVLPSKRDTQPSVCAEPVIAISATSIVVRARVMRHVLSQTQHREGLLVTSAGRLCELDRPRATIRGYGQRDCRRLYPRTHRPAAVAAAGALHARSRFAGASGSAQRPH